MTNLTFTKVPTTAFRYDPLKEYIPGMSHIRVYAYAPGVVNVQIRSESTPRRLKHWQTISNAHLDLKAAEAVRDALAVWIEDQRRTAADGQYRRALT